MCRVRACVVAQCCARVCVVCVHLFRVRHIRVRPSARRVYRKNSYYTRARAPNTCANTQRTIASARARAESRPTEIVHSCRTHSTCARTQASVRARAPGTGRQAGSQSTKTNGPVSACRRIAIVTNGVVHRQRATWLRGVLVRFSRGVARARANFN